MRQADLRPAYKGRDHIMFSTIVADGIAAQLGLSAILIAATTFVHALFIALAAAIFRSAASSATGVMRVVRDSFALVVISTVLMVAHATEIWLWAATFLRLELFDGLEPALYFAAVSYTTLGFGDVIVDPPWRLLSGAAAANGLLLFGLSAAFLVEIAVKLRLGGPR